MIDRSRECMIRAGLDACVDSKRKLSRREPEAARLHGAIDLTQELKNVNKKLGFDGVKSN